MVWHKYGVDGDCRFLLLRGLTGGHSATERAPARVFFLANILSALLLKLRSTLI